jgi:hypothetical protein
VGGRGSGETVLLGFRRSGWHPELAKQFSAVLVDGRLEYRNLANIEKIHNDAAAKLLQEQKAKAEQKSPF